jgi:hypothetical protein
MSERIDLYELLPSVYRIRDVEQDRVLKALIDIISEQAEILRENTGQLWDDFFIETCADWVIPYIGDLVGVNPLHSVAAPSRADVAKTIYYRRRKGTLPMLEEVARDVTGWPTCVAAAFELLNWTQNVNHVRHRRSLDSAQRNPDTADRVRTVNVRDVELIDRLGGPFDVLAHTIDVRPIDQLVGRHGIRTVAFHQWRLKPYSIYEVPARQSQSAAYGYTFSPLGNRSPLFTNPEAETGETELAGEVHVPTPIRRLAFHFRTDDYYGDGKSLWIYRLNEESKKVEISPSLIRSADLSQWRPTTGEVVAVDVARGRIAFSAEQTTGQLFVDYTYGFSADIGGGPYDRAGTLADDEGDGVFFARVGEGEEFETLQGALNAWPQSSDATGVVRIEDNGTYAEDLTIDLLQGCQLTIEAADQKRPTVRTETAQGAWTVSANSGSAELRLNGLLFEGGLDLQGDIKLGLAHCTLVPGRGLEPDGSSSDDSAASIIVSADNSVASAGASVEIDKCIVGPIRLPETCDEIRIRDSIVDGLGGAAITTSKADGSAPPASIERSTVLGSIEVKQLTLASDSLFTGSIKVDRQQAGCVRFSYVPHGIEPDASKTPRQYRCQPNLALKTERARVFGEDSPESLSESEQQVVRSRVVPSFTSAAYGHPAYGQLRASCAREIVEGAENGSEMGAFCHLNRPQRETNLRIRLKEYLPFGLRAGAIYET